MHKAAAFFMFMSLLIKVVKTLFFISLRKLWSKLSQIFCEVIIVFFIKVALNCRISLVCFSSACFFDNSSKNWSKLLFIKLFISC